MSKNKYFPKVKLFGKKQIERWAGPHFLCIDARLHLLYCISWPNYYTLLHTEMQNADKMHFFVVSHNSQIVAKVVIFILSQLGHLHMSSEMQDFWSNVFFVIHKLPACCKSCIGWAFITLISISLSTSSSCSSSPPSSSSPTACETSSGWSALASPLTSVVFRTRRGICAGKNYWHDWIKSSFPQMVI